MRYQANADLPHNVSSHLPDHAQSIFRKAFNNAYIQYGTEEQAFKVAWAAAKGKYEKEADGNWIRKTSS